jgi:hypothetical protein
MGFFSRPDGSWLTKRFGPQIAIEVRDDKVVFRTEKRTVSIAPTIFLHGNRIAGFGVRPDRGAKELSVFTGDSPGASCEQLLSKLLIHGITQVLQRSLTIRPNVDVAVRTPRVSVTQVLEALKLAGVRNAKVT